MLYGSSFKELNQKLYQKLVNLFQKVIQFNRQSYIRIDGNNIIAKKFIYDVKYFQK